MGNALATAEHAYRLLVAGPAPLALDGKRLGHGLPPRALPLPQVRELMLDRAPGVTASFAAKDAIWRELATRARRGEAACVIGCFGLAMPGLKMAAERATRGLTGDAAAEVVSELVAAFLEQIHTADLDRRSVVARMIWAASRSAGRCRQGFTQEMPHDPHTLPGTTPASSNPRASGVDHAPEHFPEPDPVRALNDAVELGVLTADEADLIAQTRLVGVRITDLARTRGVPQRRLYGLRERAEIRLRTAITEGHIPITAGGLDGNRGR